MTRKATQSSDEQEAEALPPFLDPFDETEVEPIPDDVLRRLSLEAINSDKPSLTIDEVRARLAAFADRFEKTQR